MLSRGTTASTSGGIRTSTCPDGAIPGFLRGRRYSVVGPGAQFLIICEVTDIEVFATPAYLERLNNPTDWTRRIMLRPCGA